MFWPGPGGGEGVDVVTWSYVAFGVTPTPPQSWTDKCLWKHNLRSLRYTGGNNLLERHKCTLACFLPDSLRFIVKHPISETSAYRKYLSHHIRHGPMWTGSSAFESCLSLETFQITSLSPCIFPKNNRSQGFHSTNSPIIPRDWKRCVLYVCPEVFKILRLSIILPYDKEQYSEDK